MSEKELICRTFFWCLIFCGLPVLKSTNLDTILCSWLNCQIPPPMGGRLGANAPWWGATTFQMSVKCLGGGWAGLVKLLWTNHSSFTIKHFFFGFFIYEEQVDSMLLCICLVIDHMQMKLKCGKNISNSDNCQMAFVPLFLFLPHFDFIYDLLLNRCTATWNLFVEWNPRFADLGALHQGNCFPPVRRREYCKSISGLCFLLKCK